LSSEWSPAPEHSWAQPSSENLGFVRRPKKLGFVSGHRFSDAINPPKSIAPSGAGGRASNLTLFCNPSCLFATPDRSSRSKGRLLWLRWKSVKPPFRRFSTQVHDLLK